MFNFFRKIRRKLAGENSFFKYSKYAIGEILLVVIGILIALSINNWNEGEKTRTVEISYLQNLKTDLKLNITELETFIISRNRIVESANIVIDYFDQQEIKDIDQFNYHIWTVLLFFPLDRSSNTFQELINSGNLAIISNDSIKNKLLDMEMGYKKIDFVENHVRHDYEGYIFDPYFTLVDVNPAMKNYLNQIDANEYPEKMLLSKKEAEIILTSKKFKNGCTLAVFNCSSLVAKYAAMVSQTEDLLILIEEEID